MTPVVKMMVTSQSVVDFTEAKGFSVTSGTLEFRQHLSNFSRLRTCMCSNPKVDPC